MLVVSSEVLVCHIVERFHVGHGIVVCIVGSFTGGSCIQMNILGQFLVPAVSHDVLEYWRSKEVVIPPVFLVGIVQ